MSQRRWIKGPICGVDNCRSRLYTSNAGQKLCQYGHIKEGDIEINDDMDDNYVPTRTLNFQISEDGTVVNLQQSQQNNSDKGKREFGQKGRLLYYQCLQIYLKKQIPCIIDQLFPIPKETKLDLEKKLNQICKLYWVKLLKYTHNNLKSYKTDVHLIVPLDIIALIYLAFIKLNYYNVYISDFAFLIKYNKIPYSRTRHLFPKHLMKRFPQEYFNRLEPARLPEQDIFVNKILKLAPIILDSNSLTQSLNYYYPFIFRILSTSLLLPNAPELMVMIHRFCHQELKDQVLTINYDADLTRADRFVQFPEVKLAGIIVFVIKLHFVFGGALSLSYKIDYNKWLSTVEKYDLQNEIPLIESSTSSDLLSYSDTKITEYCKWVYNSMVPYAHKEADDPANQNDLAEEDHADIPLLEKRLYQIFNFDQSSFSLQEDEVTSSQTPLSNIDFISRIALLSSTSKLNRSIKAEDSQTIESFLIKKLADYINVSPTSIKKSYLIIESIIANSLSENANFKIINSSTKLSQRPRSASPSSEPFSA